MINLGCNSYDGLYYEISAYEIDDGWRVDVCVGDDEFSSSSFYPYSGGEWQLLDDTLGQQITGTCDVKLPKGNKKFVTDFLIDSYELMLMKD